MKNLLMFSFLFSAPFLFSQPDVEPTGVKLTTAVEPSSIILSKFSYDNPNIRAIWSKEEDNIFAAQYRDETTNLGKITRYDINGNVLSKATELENNTSPVVISKYYVKKYPNEKFSTWLYESKGTKTYYISRTDETLWFNGNGKYLRSVKKDVGTVKGS